MSDFPFGLNADDAARGLACARDIAEWICLVQRPARDNQPAADSFSFLVCEDGREDPAYQWNYAFASMGLLAARRAFEEPRYESAALRLGRYLKSLQIFSPFLKQHYGAIREVMPRTPWCYTRDGLSAAWGFLELHRHTGDDEYLRRALLWADWFFREGIDEEGWPTWGAQFELWFEGCEPVMCPEIQASCEGGCLSFLYHLWRATGDEKWIGAEFRTMADFLIVHIQQDSGFYATIERATHRPPAVDPQAGLHRANDDLCSLGLLAAHQVTGDARYLRSVERFLDAVFAGQHEDGAFDHGVAGIPVPLNTLYEASDLVSVEGARTDAVRRALACLYAAQSDGAKNARMKGAFHETGLPSEIEALKANPSVAARSSCYALIVLLKLFSPDLKGTTLLAVPAPQQRSRNNNTA